MTGNIIKVNIEKTNNRSIGYHDAYNNAAYSLIKSHSKQLRVLLYRKQYIINPFTGEKNRLIFADDTASGRPCKLVDRLIEKNVIPYYSNTHSNAYCGILMKDMIERCRIFLRQELNVSDEMKIIFSGSGCTGSINHLISLLSLDSFSQVTVYISYYEHHSNFLPWHDNCKNHANATIKFINNTDTMGIDVEQLKMDINNLISCSIENANEERKKKIIISIIETSNVCGRRFAEEIEEIWNYIGLIKRQTDFFDINLFVDYACSAPYSKIDGAKCDGLFFSGHKFLGGQQTPGCLVVRKDIIKNNCPYNPGGGCVRKADLENIIYLENVENREPGGTPNIMGIIRLYYTFLLKTAILETITEREHRYNIYCNKMMGKMIKKYHNFHVIFFEHRSPTDLPIYPIFIDGLHYNLIIAMLSDLFGIQARGGISCCGLLARIIKDRYNIDGWCRLSFSYLLDDNEIDVIFVALQYIVENGHQYISRYHQNENNNLFTPLSIKEI